MKFNSLRIESVNDLLDLLYIGLTLDWWGNFDVDSMMEELLHKVQDEELVILVLMNKDGKVHEAYFETENESGLSDIIEAGPVVSKCRELKLI